MKKVSEYRDGDALDLLADVIEPVTNILGDSEVVDAFNKTRLRGVSIAIKKHKSDVIKILARLDDVPVEDYHCNFFTLPGRVLEILSDDELLSFFSGQGQIANIENASGPVMESIEETVKA